MKEEMFRFSIYKFFGTRTYCYVNYSTSFAHSVSSLMIGKMQGNIIDTLYAPLSAAEVTLAIILAAVTRSLQF